jgi:hypothetical protein
VGIAVTASAIFGSVYKGAAPTIYAACAGVGVFVVGLLLTFVFAGRTPASTHFTEPAPAERGPVEL